MKQIILLILFWNFVEMIYTNKKICIIINDKTTQAKFVISYLMSKLKTLDIYVCSTCSNMTGKKLFDFYTIEKYSEDMIKDCDYVFICSSDNNFKKHMYFDLCINRIINPFSNKHYLENDDVSISQNVIINTGTIINNKVTIQFNVRIGKYCMIHSGCIIEHDCFVDDFVNLSPGTILCGHVSVGECTTIYAGAVVFPGIKIGKHCIIGGGSIIKENIPDYTVVIPKVETNLYEIKPRGVSK